MAYQDIEYTLDAVGNVERYTNNTYGDHLGSAQLVTDWSGSIYEHLEYTPYGELWVDHATSEVGMNPTVFRFTGKELDVETGFYYYGARYLDPKTSRWISADPAMGEYIPVAPINDEAKKHNQNLPGMGGIYNTVNMHVYHYGGNNPVKLTDPDGNQDIGAFIANYFENLIDKMLSLPGITMGNAINSAKNFVGNFFKGESDISIQFIARVANSKINISLNISGEGVSLSNNPNLVSQLEAVGKSPVRTITDKKGNLTGLEFHVPVGDAQAIGQISAILGANFDLETGDATTIIGAKLSGPDGGWAEGSSISLKLLLKISTIGEHPTVQGGDFVNVFKDQASRERYNEVWGQ